MNIANPAAALSFDDMILSQGREIFRKLNLLRHENFPPDARKNMLRQFSMAEAAYFLGVSPSNLKKLHLEGKGVEPTILTGGRAPIVASRFRNCASGSTRTAAPK